MKPYRPFKVEEGLGHFAFFGQHAACEIPGCNVVRIGTEGVAECGPGGFGLPGPEENLGEASGLAGQTRVELDRLTDLLERRRGVTGSEVQHAGSMPGD